jgi:hypothetical protein
MFRQSFTETSAMPSIPTPSIQYRVELVGMPEAFAPRRQALIQRFMDAMIEAYGSEAAATGALHAYLDSIDLEPGEVAWDVVQTRVVATMGLPPGATFRCSVAGLRG